MIEVLTILFNLLAYNPQARGSCLHVLSLSVNLTIWLAGCTAVLHGRARRHESNGRPARRAGRFASWLPGWSACWWLAGTGSKFSFAHQITHC